MIRVLLAALLVLTLAAFGGCSPLLREGVPAQCDQQGFVACKSQARWDGDPASADAWDNLAADTLSASRAETRTCEIRRKALEQCLVRLEKQRIIDLGGAP